MPFARPRPPTDTPRFLAVASFGSERIRSNTKGLSKRTSGFGHRAAAALLILYAASFGSVATAQTITTIAGGGVGDGGAATNSHVANPHGVALDASGNLFIAEYRNQRVRKVTPAGVITTVAGNGIAGFSGDLGFATDARLNGPIDVAIDSSGTLYIAELDNRRIRKVSSSGIITTIAGNGAATFNPDGSAATSGGLYNPNSVAVDSAGNVYVAETSNNRVRVISPAGIISTFAGNGTAAFTGDGGAATSASLNGPVGVAVDVGGNVFIGDTSNHRVRKVDTAGVITTFAGTGSNSFSGDGGAATSAAISMPRGLTVDSLGDVYIVDFNQRIRKVTTAGMISTVAGNGIGGAFSGDGGPAISASLWNPNDVAVDASGSVFIADQINHRVRKVSSGIITTFAGNGSISYAGDGDLATNAAVSSTHLAFDSAGNLYIADVNNHRVRKVTAAGIISTVAGSGVQGFSGDGGSAVSAALSFPSSLAIDANDNLFIADVGNYRVRKVGTDGLVSTYAGNGSSAYSGDGGAATNAGMYPLGLALDVAGNLYIADANNHRIRRVTPGGIVSTIGGTGVTSDSGDGGPAISAGVLGPYALALDAGGNLYIAQQGGNRIRRISTTGTISTIAGTGIQGFAGDGGPATSARLNQPNGVTVDVRGTIYVSDSGNRRVRRVSTSGTITAFAGNGSSGFSGDGGPAINAAVGAGGVITDAIGHLYIAAGRVRKVSLLVPGAPAIGTATASDASASVTFSAPGSDGGSAISGYTATCGAQSAGGTSSPITVTGLPNGTAVTCTVTATNVVGTSAASSPSNSVTPAGVPAAPTIGAATRGNASASVAFTAGADNGSPITGFTATCGTQSVGGTSSPIVVSGLTNGTPVTCTVTATNVVGTSVASSASNSVTPATVPGAPTIGVATRGNASASVAFTAGADNGSQITGFTATCGTQSAGGLSSPIVVSGLTNGTPVTCTVIATNGVGPSTASSPSNSVTPAGVPSAPTIGVATRGDGSVSVAFTAGADNGSAITGFTATCGTQSAGGLSSPIVVSGLTNGTPVTCTVTATNVVGTSVGSSQSNSVTPATVPGAPTIGPATRGNASVSVTFTAGADNGSPITGFTATCGTQSAGGLTSPILVSGLTNGTPVTCTVTATNAVGPGPASSASNSVTPAGVPAAPTIGTATRGNASASVAFTAGADNGSPITGFTATCGTQSAGGLSSPIVVSGLTNGTAVTCTVTATNSAGASPASAASNSVTPAAVPGAPTAVSAVAAGGNTTVSFTAPSSNGSPITSFTATCGTQSTNGAASPLVVSGVSSGTCTVTATNDVGTGPASAAAAIPGLAITSKPPITAANQASYSIGGTCSIDARAVNVQIGSIAATGTCGTPATGQFATTAANVSALAQGAVSLTATMSDGAGNSVSVTDATTKDTVGPALTIDALDAISSANRSAYAFGGSCEAGGGSVSYTLTSTAVVNGAVACGAGTYAVSNLNVSTLADGTVAFSVTQSDAVGNSATTNGSVVKDATNPLVTIDSPATITAANQASYRLSGTCSEAGRAVNVLVGSIAATTNCGTPAAGAYEVTGLDLSAFAEGSVAISAALTDSVGNSATANATANKDTVASAPVIASPVAGSTVAASPTISGSGAESGAAVTVREGATTVCTATAVAGGTWTCASTLGVGSHTLTVSQTDTAGNVSAASTGVTFSVKATPSVTLASNGNPSVALQSVSFTATLAGVPAPTGAVVFKDGGTAIAGCSSVALSGGQATCSTAALAVGAHSVTAEYGGDGNYNAALSNTVSQSVAQASQAIVFGAIANKVLGDAPFAVSATGGGSGNPVTFSSTTTSVCTTGGTNGSTVTLVALGTCIIAANQAGNSNYQAASPVQQSFQVQDATAPDTTITANPASVSNSTSATFSFTGSDPSGSGVASFTCSLDGAGFAACVSPKAYTSLTAGAHTFQVRSIDSAGNVDPTPATFGWTIDTTAPALAITSKPAITAANQASYSVGGTCSDGGRQVSVQIDSIAATGTCGTPATGQFATAAVNVSSLAQGAVNLSASITDAAGNTTSVTDATTKDTVGPSLSIGTLDTITNANKATYAFAGSCETGGGPVSYSLSSTASVTGSVACNSGGYAVTALNVASLSDGTVMVQVTQADSLGNSTTTPGTVAKDTGNPSVTLDAPTRITTANRSNYAVSGTCSEAGRTVSVSVGSVSGSGPCGTPGAGLFLVAGLDVSALADGSVAISASLTDGVGNSASANATATKDTLSSVPVIDSPIAASVVAPNPTISGSGAENLATVTVREGTTTVCTATASATGTWSCASSLGLGSHTIAATQVDTAGNTSASSAAVTFSVKTTATIALSSSANPASSGQPVTFTATFSGAPTATGTVTFKDGAVVLSGCSALALSSGAAQCAASGLSSGSHSITAEFAGDGNYLVSTSSALNQVVDADANPPRLANISTRTQVLRGDNVLIGGFIIGGFAPKTVVVRARGPSLLGQGVPNALANPMLNLYSAQTVIASNDDWQTASNAAAVLASGFAPSNGAESAILVTLNPGPYSAIVTGSGGSTGVGMIEVFEVDALTTPLINISTRGPVLTGDDVMIGGIIIHGSGPQTVLVRGRGPSLTAFGVPNALANPFLDLYSGQTVIATNDNWQTAANAATIQSLGFAPSDPNEAAILVTLNPGAYSAILRGAGGTIGVGLIEFFRVP